MKARIRDSHNSSIYFSKDGLISAERTMKQTWSEFRLSIANKEFEYDDTKSALNTIFLKQFDEWFQGIGKTEMSRNLSEYFEGNLSGRGSIIKVGEPKDTPKYDRLMPKAEFIKEDNRFSPSGIEWLYLSIGNNEETIMTCAEMECRAKSNDRFAFCKFKPNTGYNGLKVVDLTIGNDISYEGINNRLSVLEKKLLKEGERYAKAHGFWAYKKNSEEKEKGIKQEVTRWCLFTYAKMISENIFVPIDTDDKKLEYAPFQTLAMYFIKEGFDGIIYSSTVYPKAKNIVLFDKNYAVPYGDVSDYVISVDWQNIK